MAKLNNRNPASETLWEAFRQCVFLFTDIQTSSHGRRNTNVLIFPDTGWANVFSLELKYYNMKKKVSFTATAHFTIVILGKARGAVTVDSVYLRRQEKVIFPKESVTVALNLDFA